MSDNSGHNPLFAVRYFSVLTYAQGFTLWHYKALGCTLAEVKAPGFFDPAADMVAPGDMVMVSARDGGSLLFIAMTGRHVVTAPLGAEGA